MKLKLNDIWLAHEIDLKLIRKFNDIWMAHEIETDWRMNFEWHMKFMTKSHEWHKWIGTWMTHEWHVKFNQSEWVELRWSWRVEIISGWVTVSWDSNVLVDGTGVSELRWDGPSLDKLRWSEWASWDSDGLVDDTGVSELSWDVLGHLRWSWWVKMFWVSQLRLGWSSRWYWC